MVEVVVFERRPFGQRIEYRFRHVGGGGLGEGEAKNFGRIGAAQQQPDDALRQHIGLARAGIGRHPGRHRRIRRLALARKHGLGDGARSHCSTPRPQLHIAISALIRI